MVDMPAQIDLDLLSKPQCSYPMYPWSLTYPDRILFVSYDVKEEQGHLDLNLQIRVPSGTQTW